MDDVRDRVSRRLRVICGESERMTLTARDELDRKRSKRAFDQLAMKQAEVRNDEALNHLLEPFPIGAPPSFSMKSGKRGMEYRQAEASKISGGKFSVFWPSAHAWRAQR